MALSERVISSPSSEMEFRKQGVQAHFDLLVTVMLRTGGTECTNTLPTPSVLIYNPGLLPVTSIRRVNQFRTRTDRKLPDRNY